MGVALVALVLSLGGTSFAQDAATGLGKLVSGAKIKRSSIPGDRLIKGNVNGDRIKSNSITGKQVNEKTLAMVPSAATAKKVAVAERATNAQRATNADNALALGGTAAAGYVTYGKAVIPSGVTVTGAFGIAADVATATAPLSSDLQQVVQLPGSAPSDLINESVNFAPTSGAGDADATCTGSAVAPTAPPGKVCLYLASDQGAGTLFDGNAIPGLAGSRAGFVVHAVNTTLSNAGIFGTWAYTAP
jgi:hypothetical protein